MTILNRYILDKFLKPFFATFLGLCTLVMFGQVVDRLDRFLADGVNITHVLGYLITSLPFQAMNVLPVACLLATLFVVGNLVKSREYIAGLAGGIPPEKILGGILVAGLGISLVGLVANETVIPPMTHYSRVVYRQKIQRLGEFRQSVFDYLCVSGADGRLWNAKLFDQSTGRMERVVVDTFKFGKMGPQIDAESAQWTKDGWVFKNGVLRNFGASGMDIVKMETFEEKIFNFEEQPDDLAIQDPQPEQMNYNTLRRHIRRLSDLGVPVRDLQVELMMKLAFPFTCFIVTLLGIPLGLRGRGNRAKGIASGFVLTLMYLGFMQFGKVMALRLIPVWLGAWLGNIVFVTLAIFLWWRLRKLV